MVIKANVGDGSEGAASPKAPAEVEALLVRQLEFYFSRNNLLHDAYLVSQMDAQKYVSVDVIAKFRKISALTEDRELLVKAMKQCKNLFLNEEQQKVRPNVKVERTTLILRDISSDTPISEIKELFETVKEAKVTNIRADPSNKFFVSFETESSCRDTALALAGRQFKGKPVRCRVKTENLLKGYFFNQPPSVNAHGMGQRYGGRPSPANRAPYGYQQGYHNQGYVQPKPPQDSPTWGEVVRGKRGNRKVKRQQAAVPRDRRSYNSVVQDTTAAVDAPEKKGAKVVNPYAHQQIPVGYAKEFRSYTRQEMASVVESLSKTKFVMPPSLKRVGKTCAALRDKPHFQCELLDPMPIMFPASPSPNLDAVPSNRISIPNLDLSTSTKPMAK